MADSIRINTNINVDSIDTYRLNSESMKNLNKSVEKLAQVMIDAIGKDTFQAVKIMNENLRQTLIKITPILEQYNYEEILKGFRFTVADMAEKLVWNKLKHFKI